MAYSIYSYNKQVDPSVLYNDIVSGLPGYPPPSVLLDFLNYDVSTFNIDVYYSTSLSAGDQTKLTNIINAYVYQDTSLNATFNDITSTNIANTSGITTNTLTANYLYGDGSNLTGIVTTDNYVTGATYSNGTLTLNRQNGSVTVNGFQTTDFYVTGGTYSNGSLVLNRQNGSVTVNGFTDYYVTGGTYDNQTGTLSIYQQNSIITISGFNTGSTSVDNYVTGGTFNNTTGVLTLNRQNGSVNIDNFTDYYVTGGTYNSGVLTLNRGNGSVVITGFDIPSGSTDNYVTGGTFNSTTGVLTLNRQNGSTDIGGFPISAGTAVDTYVTGFTFSNNVLTISQNQGQPDLTATITDYFVTGGTYSNGIITLNRGNGSFIVSGLMSADTFTTGVTFNNSTLTISQNNGTTNINTLIPLITGATFTNGTLFLNRNSGPITVTGIMSADTTVTGFTYDNANVITLSRNSGQPNLTINITTGTTQNINGDLIVTGKTVSGLLQIVTSPISGYILTSDVDGNATWQPSPLMGSGSTKLDYQSVTGNTTVTSTNNSSTWVDIGAMTITARNLTTSATTYTFNFSCSAALSSNSGVGNIRVVANGNPIAGTNRQRTNISQINGLFTPISTNGFITGVKSGDIIKVQFNSPTGQWTVTDRAFTIMGILNSNIV